MLSQQVTISRVLSLAVLLVIAAFFVWQPDYIGANCAMYIECARLLLSGQKPYVDFIDLNPPMIMYLACLPVYISKLFSLPVVATFQAVVLLVVSLSFVLTEKFCLRLYKQDADYAFLLVPFALSLSNLPLLFCFGERDHLIVLALVPFFFYRMLVYAEQGSKLESVSWEQSLIGIFAGLAICLKPQSALILLTSELYFIVSSVKKKPALSLDMIVLAGTLAIYAVHFCFLPTPVKEAFCGWLLPLMEVYYKAFNVPFAWAASLYCYLGPIVRFSAYVTLIGLAILVRRQSRLCPPLICFAAAAYVVYLLQSRGWGYQTIPALTACFLLCAALIPIFLKRLLDWSKISLPGNKLLPLQMALLIFLTPCFALDSSLTGKELNDCDAWIKKYTSAGESVLIISSAVSPAYPSLVKLNRPNGSRYLWSAPLVMLEYGQKNCSEAERNNLVQQENLVFKRLEQDIHERKPKLVMIEYYPAIGPSLFEIATQHGFLQKDLIGYKRLGICNRFVGFLAQDAAPALCNSDNNPTSQREPDQAARLEQFRQAGEAIARADRKILLQPTAQDYLSRGRAYDQISMHQQALSDFEQAEKLTQAQSHLSNKE